MLDTVIGASRPDKQIWGAIELFCLRECDICSWISEATEEDDDKRTSAPMGRLLITFDDMGEGELDMAGINEVGTVVLLDNWLDDCKLDNCCPISSGHNAFVIEPLQAGEGVDASSGHGDSAGSTMDGVTESGRISWLFPLDWENESIYVGPESRDPGRPKPNIFST